jgi:hypothetical protein
MESLAVGEGPDYSSPVILYYRATSVLGVVFKGGCSFSAGCHCCIPSMDRCEVSYVYRRTHARQLTDSPVNINADSRRGQEIESGICLGPWFQAAMAPVAF